MFRSVEYFQAFGNITNPHISYVLTILADEISDINLIIRDKRQTFNLGEYKEPIKADDDIKSDDDLKAEIESLKTEISHIKRALEVFSFENSTIKEALKVLGVEYTNGVFIVKEQQKKKFLGLF